jgi:outer membrane protein TolC
MRGRALLPPLALLLLAGACTRPPHASLDPAQTLRNLQLPTPLPGGDLATALTTVAWQDHPDLDLARAELATARAGIQTAKALPNPSFGFGATKAEGVPQPWTLTYGLAIPVELGGKRRLRVRQAELQVQAAQLAVADTAWRLRMGVRSALVDWQQAREDAALADRSAALWSQLLALQDRRLALGEIAGPEHAATAQEARRAEAARLTAQEALRRAQATLALAAGVPEATLAPRLASEPPPDLSPGAAAPPPQTEALLHRLDVRRVLLDWDRNETTLDQEVAQRVPNLNLGPGYSFDQGVKKWTLGFTVELPIFDRRQGPIAEALARRKVIEAQLRQTEAQDLAGASLAGARLTAAREALKAQLQALQATQSRLAVAKRTLALGGSDRGSLLAAELEALQARGLAVDAWAETARARLAVEAAFQKPLDSTERPYPIASTPGARP